jgi:hypothetical protein
MEFYRSEAAAGDSNYLSDGEGEFLCGALVLLEIWT